MQNYFSEQLPSSAFLMHHAALLGVTDPAKILDAFPADPALSEEEQAFFKLLRSYAVLLLAWKHHQEGGAAEGKGLTRTWALWQAAAAPFAGLLPDEAWFFVSSLHLCSIADIDYIKLDDLAFILDKFNKD